MTAGCASVLSLDVVALAQVPSCSAKKRVTGHAPSVVFEMTVCVTSDRGSWTERNETPASSFEDHRSRRRVEPEAEA